jgi:RNA polymerase sigma-70 factor, ECF subfamily
LKLQDSALRDANAELDRQLIQAVARGSGDALSELYDRHASIAYGLARRILPQPDVAEEVVQDVFAQVWRDAPRYERERATVAGWIVLLTRTRAIDRLRARKARPDQAAGVEPSAAPALVSTGRSPEAVTISEEEVKQVRGALGELPEDQRTLVELAYYEGLTHTEIAERTGVPLGTVKTRLRTAMMALRMALSA